MALVVCLVLFFVLWLFVVFGSLFFVLFFGVLGLLALLFACLQSCANYGELPGIVRFGWLIGWLCGWLVVGERLVIGVLIAWLIDWLAGWLDLGLFLAGLTSISVKVLPGV